METPDSPWPTKAYKNLEFLNSPAARKVRVLCEMTEPEDRFRREKVEDTIVLFGSARMRHPDEAKQELFTVEEKYRGRTDLNPDEADELRVARQRVKTSVYYLAAMRLAEEMTRWSLSLPTDEHRFLICSGGGPGIMEAANRGASLAGGKSIGLGISLPFEQGVNRYIPKNLQFEFHYFFIRKYWFMYWAKALVVFPGGFGTMDELFETLTLVQTGKVAKRVPIVLFGSEFWNSILNFQAFVDWGVISARDCELFRVFDDVEAARDYLIAQLTEAFHLG